MPDDYLKMIGNLHHHLSARLIFIRPEESKWAAELGNKAKWGSYLIGRISGAELHMLHCHEETVARRKWESRVSRVNYDQLIFKFNDQNGATADHFKAFDGLNLEHERQSNAGQGHHIHLKCTV